MVNAFTRELGLQQGRLQPVGVTPADGDWALVLGTERAGDVWALNVGDYLEWTQTAQFAASTTLFRITAARFRGPAAPTVGAAWRFLLLVDGVERARHDIEAGRTVDKVTLAANVTALAGTYPITLRLEVV